MEPFSFASSESLDFPVNVRMFVSCRLASNYIKLKADERRHVEGVYKGNRGLFHSRNYLIARICVMLGQI